MDSKGDWGDTPKISHVRPTVRQLQPARRNFMDESSPFPDVETGPLTPSPYPTPAGDGLASQTAVVPMETLQSLRGEMHTIAELLQKQTLAGAGDGSKLLEENSRLERANRELRETLSDSERRLLSLQESVASLNEEYRAESSELAERVAELAESAGEERERREESDRLREQAERARRGLETYLSTLPSRDAFDEVKRKLRACEEERGRTREKVSELATALRLKNGELAKTMARIAEMENETSLLKSKLQLAETELAEDVQRRQIAVEMGSGDGKLETVLKERDVFGKECERLKKYVRLAEAKQKKDLKCLTRELGRVREELSAKEGELEEAAGALKQEESTNSFLRQDLTKARGEAAGCRARAKALEAELEAAGRTREDARVADRASAALTLELSRCCADLGSLTRAAGQLARGEEPAVSELLGIADASRFAEEEGAATGEETGAERAARLRELLDTVRAARADIVGLRDDLSQRYAESLGDDMNSCITQ